MNQKKLTILTLFVVIAGAVSINEFIIRKGSAEQNRDVANMGQRFQPEQIKWEQELAKTVADQNTGRTLIGERPNSNEQLLFGALQGKYEASVVNGKLLKITLLPNQLPVEMKTDQLIGEYAAVFKDAKSFESNGTTGGTENVSLKNVQGQVIGQVSIHRNDEGRVLNIEIQ